MEECGGKSKIKYDFVIQDPLLPDILSSAP